MTTIRVIRKNLGTGKERIVSGYDRIPISLAIQFLEYEAKSEAKQSKLTIRDDDIEENGKIIHRRFLVEEFDGNKKDVVLFYLKCVQTND
jgi:hypothetical protein